MKILFLDIDGVLNSTRTCVAFGGYPMELYHLEAFDQVAIRLIRRLCDSAGVQVVLSSAWRLTHDFKDVGKTLELPIIDRTPSLCGARGLEINAWLAAHPGVEQYAIIDDDPDMLPSQQNNFVQTSHQEGMNFADYQKLCAIFGENAYSGAPRERNWQDGAGIKLAWDR